VGRVSAWGDGVVMRCAGDGDDLQRISGEVVSEYVELLRADCDRFELASAARSVGSQCGTGVLSESGEGGCLGSL